MITIDILRDRRYALVQGPGIDWVFPFPFLTVRLPKSLTSCTKELTQLNTMTYEASELCLVATLFTADLS